MEPKTCLMEQSFTSIDALNATTFMKATGGFEMKITTYEKKNYILNDKKNLQILGKIKEVEKIRLNKKDKEAIKLIRTQLKKDWQTPLIKYLNKLLKKYKIGK